VKLARQTLKLTYTEKYVESKQKLVMAERRIKMLNMELDQMKLARNVVEGDILSDISKKGIQFNTTIHDISFIQEGDCIIEEKIEVDDDQETHMSGMIDIQKDIDIDDSESIDVKVKIDVNKYLDFKAKNKKSKGT
jgi:hypothetical protein